MNFLAEHELRAPAPDDFDAVAGVMTADELDHCGHVTLGADFLRAEWSRTGFDPAADAWVAVRASGTIVGYGQVALEEPSVVQSWGCVDPGHRGRGIGSALLDRIELRAAGLLEGVAAARFRHAIYASDQAAAAMLRARGLRPVRHFWHMQIDLAGPVSPGEAPPGIDIGPPGDLRVVHGVIDQALAEHWGHHSEPFEQWLEAAAPGHDPSLWLLASDQGRPVGALTASSGDDGGWVDWLGVLASHRGRGIAAALLRRSFAMFAGRAAPCVRVSVDAGNASGATGVYERAGMRVVKAWDMWERS